VEVSENSLPNLLEHRPTEGSAAGQTARYIEVGYKNAKALKGGVSAWKEAGYLIQGENK